MYKVILNLMKLQTQLRVLHWQTKSFAEHQAFGQAYDSLDDLIDGMVEVYQGKHGRIVYPEGASLDIFNYGSLKVTSVLDEVTGYLSTTFNENIDEGTDTDLLNIRDEVLHNLNKLKYLVTLA
jgi:hypothetical protein